MPQHCSAYNCSNRRQKNNNTTFHRFPKDKELRKRWVIATKRENFTPSSSTVLCSKHFEDDDFEVGGIIRKLKKNALPKLFDFPSHLAPPKPKSRRILFRLQDDSKETEASLSAERSQQVTTPNTSDHERATENSTTKPLLRRKVKILQQKLRRRDKKIKSMKDMLAVLKKKLNAPDRLLEVLEEKFSGFPLDMILHTLNKSKKCKYNTVYSEKMKEFALTVYFYSPKAYKYLRSINFLLPNPSTLRRWLSSFNCSPGFLEEVFAYFKGNVNDKEHLKHVNLVFDAMSIRKQIIFDDKKGKYIGYISLGNDLNVDEHETVASEALVFQIVSLKGNFKCVVGYFFIDKINSDSLSKLIKMCITKLFESGIHVNNVTFDGTSTNIMAVKKLGCVLPDKPFFNVKVENVNLKVCVILDACHMLKLARNTLSDKGIITSMDGIVDFKYVQKLNTVQKEQGMKFANKLTDRHIFYHNNKMNVKVAAQTLSAGVADAIEFLMSKGHPDFVGAKPTVEFIRIIDRLFDFFNSRDPYGKHYKQPIRKKNEKRDAEMLDTCFQYLKTLQIEGINVLQHPRKTFALGFLTNISSIKILATKLFDELQFKYILTYKLSQDHLELLFSCIRSRGGNNNNPNVRQFQLALRHLMFRNSVQSSDKSNCIPFDLTIQNSVLGFEEIEQSVDNCLTENDEEELACIRNIMENDLNSYYKDNVLYYVCGFIVSKITPKIKCEECKQMLTSDDSNLSPYTHFTDYISKGKLVRSSSDAMKVVKFLHYSLSVYDKCSHKLNTKKLILLACTELASNVFKNHISNVELGEDTHEIRLIKLIGNMFLKIMCFNFSKEKTLALVAGSKLGIRQKFNKLVLFSNT